MTAPILLIDNYDSFVYNLARYFDELGCRTVVMRNDAVSISDVRRLDPAAIVLSPGPCTPDESGICTEVVRQLGPDVPMLGVCLGHQAIATACGARIMRTDPMHGRTSQVFHEGRGLFAGLPIPLTAARYHSLVVDEETLPEMLAVTARCADGTIMALEHRDGPVYGVQFHPESVLTEGGHLLLSNFLRLSGIPACEVLFAERASGGDADEDFFARSIQYDQPPPSATRVN